MKLASSHFGSLLFIGSCLLGCGSDSVDTGETQGAGQTDDVAADSCESAEGAEAFEPPMVKTGAAGYEISLMGSSPAPPARYDNTWEIRVLDPSGEPVTDAAIVVIPYMPEHRHGSNRDAIVTNHEDGTYTTERVNFTMGGVWVTTIRIEGADGAELDSATFAFCIP